MIILEATLTHFGKFHNKTIRFSPGINIIYGENEAGKTTLHSFLRGMILGIEKPRGRETKDDLYSKYLPWETPTLYGGSLTVWDGERNYQIERRFYKENKFLRVTDLTTGRSQDYESWQVPPQFGRVTKANYRNTISLEQGKGQTGQELEAEMKNYMANLTTSRSTEVDISYALQSLQDRKKELRDPKLVQRLEQLEREVEELPILERQQNHLEVEIEGLLQEQKATKQTNQRPAKEPEEQVSIPGKRRISIAFGLLWVMAQLFLMLLQGDLDGKRVPLHVMLAVIGLLIYLVLRKREVQPALAEYSQVERENWQEEEDSGEEKQKSLRLERLYWELEQVEEKISRLGEREEERGRVQQKLEAIKENIEALDLAIKTIQQLSQELHDGFGKQFNQRISRYADQVTDHRYAKVYVDESLGMKVQVQHTLVPLSKLSTGTKEQLYLALRLSAAELLLEQEQLPIILDDSLAFYDEARCKATLGLLAGLNRQILLFTCHKREQELLEQGNLPYHMVEF